MMMMSEFLFAVFHEHTKRRVNRNTRVVVEGSLYRVYLYGSEIFQWDRRKGGYRFTLAGWPTRTTVERISQCVHAVEYFQRFALYGSGTHVVIQFAAVPPKAWVRGDSYMLTCEDEAAAIEATKAYVADKKCFFRPALRRNIESLYGRIVDGSDTAVLPAMTLLRIYTEKLERRDKSRTA